SIPSGQPTVAGLGDDEDGQAVLRLLRWLQNPRDEQSARKVIQHLNPSLMGTFEESVRTGVRQGLSLEASLAEAPETEEGNRLRRVLSQIVQWRLLTRDAAQLFAELKAQLPSVVDDVDQAEGWNSAIDQMDDTRRNISNLPHLRLTDFLAGLPTTIGHGSTGARRVADPDTVSLLTYHQAKGLEFVAVFLVGLEDGVFPDFRSADDSHRMEEERRLFYVGITRAKRYLYLTSARARPARSA
ncbi:MAG: ATP-binding domain-containing protein, partial [Chloroflexi bacterium]|nr:ATP-binding domain-containing protein [Chloroflexota bacterium]